MRIFTPRAYTETTHATAIDISSFQSEDKRETARELRIEAALPGTPPELAASLRQEANTLDEEARKIDRWQLKDHRLPPW